MRRPHNSNSHRVLAVGRDISLMSSRANLLTQAGYSTDLLLETDRVVGRAKIGRYQLAVISAAFTRDEQLAIRTRLKQVSHSLPVLLLGPEHDSPEALLAAVADCLKLRKALHAGIKRNEFSPDHRVK